MSFTRKKQDQIKHYILEKIDSQQKTVAKSASEAYAVSLNTVYRYLRELQESGTIRKEGAKYLLNETQKSYVLHRKNGELNKEDEIYKDKVREYIDTLPENVRRIWEYSFMEMMNNAIDHSSADEVEICIRQNALNTSITIKDNGIGIFRKIQEFYHYPTIEDTISELFKGKLTTDRENHSGEGIFFTSRVLDSFAAISGGKIFTHDNYSDIMETLKDSDAYRDWKDFRGTCICMKLSNSSQKKLREVFDMFSDVDGGFTKTEIPLKNIYDTFPVSRSQAKRLCNRCDRFEKVVLDFSQIDEIGQAFAHEIFMVFQKKHPEIEIIPVNMNETVKKMVNHVLRS